ncbi:MAG: NAD(P)H-hydrate dehydratase [Agathobacter sp.]|nr:NAD(P)H-hydrate dehydratase [Agathobacter sp.]
MMILRLEKKKVRGDSLKYIVTGKEMKILDQNTSEHFQLPTVVLMEQAATSFVQNMIGLIQETAKILVICGSGNNGADGIAVARLLNQRGYNASVLFLKEEGSELFNLQKKIYEKYGYSITKSIIDGFDVYVDAIFGIGLSRVISGEFAEVINCLNKKQNAIRIALDIPSGISADDGQVLGIAFKSDFTITFSFAKTGLLLWPGTDYCGKVIVADMGITADSFLDNKPRFASITKEDKKKLLPQRPEHSNKGTFGKLLIIAGSHNMAGAACFAAKAAYRSGVGLVKVITSESNRIIIQGQVPEVVLQTYDKLIDDKMVIQSLQWADAVVIGPGIGINSLARELVDIVLKNIKVPLVLDADALNIISDNTDRLLNTNLEIIVTPHLGEMSRLTKDAVSLIQSRLLKTAIDFSEKYELICVLKDFHTITSVQNGMTYINQTGNNGMATAGSGDVLCGIIGALLAQGVMPEYAAALGVYIHGEAGDNVFNKTGSYGMMASDIIEGIKVI